MKKFRMKETFFIEAEQWFKQGDVPEAEIHLLDADWADMTPCSICNQPFKDHGNCKTLTGWSLVCPGDWIKKEYTDKGKPYFEPVNRKYFERAYKEMQMVSTGQKKCHRNLTNEKD